MSTISPEELAAALTNLREDLTTTIQDDRRRHNQDIEEIRHDLFARLNNNAKEWEDRHNDNLEKIATHVHDLKQDFAKVVHTFRTEQDEACAIALDTANRYNEKARATDARMLLDKIEALQAFIDQEHCTAYERAQETSALLSSVALAIGMLLEALDHAGSPSAVKLRHGPS